MKLIKYKEKLHINKHKCILFKQNIYVCLIGIYHRNLINKTKQKIVINQN